MVFAVFNAYVAMLVWPLRTIGMTVSWGQRAAAAMDFDALKSAVGFPAYYAEEARYRT